MQYDYLLVGATGQVGRCLLRWLVTRGRVAVLMRRSSLDEAERELRGLQGDGLAPVGVYLGDILTAALPASREIVHAAGLTKFSGTMTEYWTANVLATLRLAHHAQRTGARLHLVSTISAASYRDSTLREGDMPTPHPGQSSYVLSKCFAELAASRILGCESLCVYRVSDVTPELPRMATDIRRNHWLTLLLGAGLADRCGLPDDYPFHVVPGDQLGRAFTALASSGLRGTFHLFGEKYAWSLLREAAAAVSPFLDRRRTIAHVGRIVGAEPSLASMVDDTQTRSVLKEMGVEWQRLDMEYWRQFARAAAAALRAHS